MDISNITIEFDTSYIDKENKFHQIEKVIRSFLSQYFFGFEVKERIHIILADSVLKTQERVDKSQNADYRHAMAATRYLDGQFIVILPIGGFKFEVFPEEVKNYPKEFVERVMLERNHLIYHEIQHIKNRYDYPVVARIRDNTLDIPDGYTYFKLSACEFFDEYLATVSSQNRFRTTTEDGIFNEFIELQKIIGDKFSKKKLTPQDVSKMAYLYSHVFAVIEIMATRNTGSLRQKIEDSLDGIEKRFFINLSNAIEKHLGENANFLISEITRIMNDFYRFGSNNAKNIVVS